MSDDGDELSLAISNVHALARRLLDADAFDIYVDVQPLKNNWRVKVTFGKFELQVSNRTLKDALDNLVQELMNGVAKRIEADTELLASVKQDKPSTT